MRGVQDVGSIMQDEDRVVLASLLQLSRTQLMLASIQPCFSKFGYQNILQFSGLFTCTLFASQFIHIPIFVALGKV